MPRPSSQRARHAAVLVPLLGLFMLLPPVIALFAGPWLPFGVPLIVLYVFGIWAALVAAAAWLAGRLDDQPLHTEAPRETTASAESAPRE